MIQRIAIFFVLTALLSCRTKRQDFETKSSGKVLYNGIILPEVWPPKNDVKYGDMDVPYLKNKPEIIPINIGRQLFVDDFLVSETNMKREYHYPHFYEDNPVLKKDRDYEVTSGAPYASPFSDGIWYDEKMQKFRMWYLTGGDLLFEEPQSFVTAYAESDDGIHWVKPDLDVIPGTNIVEPHWRDSNVMWLDKEETDPAKKYKLFNVEYKEYEPGKRGWILVLRYSADGIHWGDIVAQSQPIGDRTTAFYNPFTEKWVLSIRLTGEGRIRDRNYLENSNPEVLVNKLDNVLFPTKNDEIVFWFGPFDNEPRHPNHSEVEPQIYNHDAIAYESIMLGYFNVWQGPENNIAAKLKVQKRNEVLLGFSRDGFHWDRIDKTPFMGVNETEGVWNWGNMQSIAGVPIIVGDSLYFYTSGRKRNDVMWDANTSTGLAKLRRDGFASMNAIDGQGFLLTEKISFDGEYLFVNAEVKGQLTAEILDAKGRVIEGFSQEECLAFSGNSTKHRLRWKSGDLSKLQGTSIRIKFYMTNGKFYSFWISKWDTGESGGYTAGGGPGLNPSGKDIK